MFKASADLLFIILQYYLRSEMKRPYLNKDLQSQAEFIVENKVIFWNYITHLSTLYKQNEAPF